MEIVGDNNNKQVEGLGGGQWVVGWLGGLGDKCGQVRLRSRPDDDDDDGNESTKEIANVRK